MPSERLPVWADDVGLGRFERPQYANSGELKADVRALLDDYDRAVRALAAIEALSAANAEEVGWQTEVHRLATEALGQMT